MSTVQFDEVNLDPGDAGLVFLPGIGFRPAEGLNISHGETLNACPIKCLPSSVEELSETVVTYIPTCEGEDGPGKWVEKWFPPLTLDPPPVYETLFPPVYDTPYYPPVYDTPYVPWYPPWVITGCCVEDPWYPPQPPLPPPPVDPPNVPLPSTMIMAFTAVAALAYIKRLKT